MFDEQVVRLDPTIKPLLDQFVCVRVVQGNGLDLSLFQFDSDLTFSAFFLNADRTIYGRFGSRSDHKDAERDISMAGFGKALDRALAWHREYPKNKSQFLAKTGAPPTVPRPEEFPIYKGKYGRSTDPAKPVQSCIHCHMIGEGERGIYFSRNERLPAKLLFPYPMPGVLGLEMDPEECSTLARVEDGSPGAAAGLKAGDEILTLEGQPLLSTADIQWVLHHADQADWLKGTARRGGKEMEFELRLAPGWREQSEISWRVSTWELRRKALGGMVLKTRQDNGTRELYVDYLGQYGEHARALKTGFKKGDVLLEAADKIAPERESWLIMEIINNFKKGDKVGFKVRRENRELSLEMPVQ